MPITPESLMTLEAYSKFRKTKKAEHIAQGMAENSLAAAELRHPLSLVRRAYGLE